MSLEDKLQAVRALLEQHNTVIGGENKPGYINITAFLENLRTTGGTSEEGLKFFAFETITECMTASNAMATPLPVSPKPLAMRIAKLFREEEAPKPKPLTANRVEHMTLDELVNHFDPWEYTNAVGKRLDQIAKGRPFIVFDGQAVNKEISQRLLNELKFGYTPVNVYMGRKVHKIGELPTQMVDENPLYPGRALRPGEICDQTNRCWEGIPLNVRQLIRIAVLKKEITVTTSNGLMVAQDVIDHALASDAFEWFQKRFQMSAAEFHEAQNDGTLPLLKIQLSKASNTTSGSGTLDFSSGKKVN